MAHQGRRAQVLAYDDDSQVTELEVHKLYGNIGDVFVRLEEIKEGNNGK